MGFFSNIKNRARRQVAPVMPMAPQPLPRVPVMPQRPRIPEALPPRSGPMNRGLPGLMNQMQGEPRMMMAVGGPLMGRAANLSRQVLSRNAGRNLPDRAMPGIGDRILGSSRGSLTYGPQQLNRIRNTENAIMAGGGLGVATLADGTQMFREPFSEENIGIMSPEAFGRDLAQLRMDVGSVVNLAKNKANEVGANINEYVGRARSAYDQEMENQRMQDLDAEQGMQPFSLLMGPDMPLTRPESQQAQIGRRAGSKSMLGGSGRTMSNFDRATLDDILADLEKKN